MIHFITVNYFSSQLIKVLSQSIENQKGLTHYQHWVVNNSIDDDEIKSFCRLNSHLNLIESVSNLGFGGGCNLALERIYSADPHALVWLINPDVILAPQAVSSVKQCFQEDPSIAILGTAIVQKDGKVWFNKGQFNQRFGRFTHYSLSVPKNNKMTAKSRWVSGCSLIFNFRQFDHCPYFDTQFFLYYEDIDICEHYYQKGYNIRVTHDYLVIHDVSSVVGVNSSNKFKNTTFSRLYFLSKHRYRLALFINLIAVLILILSHSLFNPDRASGRIQGLGLFLRRCLL
jgi:N-acetylglucosaminyl-diphospho-decaprenol L-rhamnosyltransferase